MAKLKWTVASKSDQGKVRSNNEDNLLVDESIGLLVVADGMGGHQSGEVASRMATQILAENLKNLVKSGAVPEKTNPNVSAQTNQLAFCVRLANQAIFEASKRYAQDRGMGTTLSALWLHDGYCSLAHVGDSRAYIARNGTLEQITRDHSLVMDQVRQGLITQEEAASSNLQHVLSRALGVAETVEADAEEHPLMDGDFLLLCTDGLTRMVSEKEIKTIIDSARNPDSISETLVEAANAAGGKDNVSVIVALIEKASFIQNLKSKFAKSKNQRPAAADGRRS
ncbi:MAG: Stp1/IreP family PP2C-type Ser/Thr phosphatase [Elusimicrobia bacterium]|nr:Stp1/IreP family PP2C-type Ser/Thr phosphatase [Elusimicrobiota bacterium]